MLSQIRVVLFDGSKLFCQQVSQAVGEVGCVEWGTRPADVLRLVRNVTPQVVLLDADLFGTPEGFSEAARVIQALHRLQPALKIICTSRAGMECARAVAPLSVYDVVTKPVEAGFLATLIRRACWLAAAECAGGAACRAPEPEDCEEEMIGTGEGIRRVFAAIRKVAATDLPVLITGESGTGKELTAKAIYERSDRKDKPFIAINCGAIPEALVESELFGHERGAFTGAVQQKKGKVEAAQGGTLFLDEIGEIPVALQVKLLRFLQEHRFERVGGHQPIAIDVRVIAATNVNLQDAIARGCFREDLYYRLAVMAIHLPPLRERNGDVLLMASAFLRQVAHRQGTRIRGFAEDAVRAMQAYPWPGNVRELLNKVRRGVVMAEAPYVTARDLELPTEEEAVSPEPLGRMREKMEGEFLAQALARHHGNLSEVARVLEISRPTLYRCLKRYGLARRAG